MEKIAKSSKKETKVGKNWLFELFYPLSTEKNQKWSKDTLLYHLHNLFFLQLGQICTISEVGEACFLLKTSRCPYRAFGRHLRVQ
jgi:hypothetical protein